MPRRHPSLEGTNLKPAKVLVTGAGALLGQGIIKSLRQAPTAYEVVGVDPDPRSAGLFWADRAYLVPRAADPGYLDGLRAVLARERPEALLVGTDVELAVLARNRAQLEAEFDTKVVVSSPNVVAIADDKWLTYRFLSDHGFPCPQSALPEDEVALEALVASVGFPLVVKPRVGARSFGVSVVRDRAALRSAIEAVPNAVVQECVGDAEHEYTSGVLQFPGDETSVVVTMRRDLKDGNTYRAYALPDSPYDRMLTQVASALEPFGPINFQFRIGGGDAKIFEINARFSGTTPIRALAGFNEVDATLGRILRKEPLTKPAIRPVAVLRYWEELVVEGHDLESLRTTGTREAAAPPGRS